MMAASAVPTVASVKFDGGDFEFNDFGGVGLIGFSDLGDDFDDVDV